MSNDLRRNRRYVFDLLDKHGYTVPLYGTAQELSQHLDTYTLVVVYFDEHGHSGDTKLLLPMYEAMRLYPDRFCSQYISSNPTKPVVPSSSVKVIYVGNRSWRVQYRSLNSWRSTKGNSSVIDIDENNIGYGTFSKYWPVYSVNLIHIYEGPINHFTPVAVNIDMLQPLGGTGVYDFLEPEDIFNLIARWRADYSDLGVS